jgi:menaquinone-dependent protoporphyrinogen oxidase
MALSGDAGAAHGPLKGCLIMKVLIAYGSSLGATAGIAERIGEVLRADGLFASVQPAASAGPIDSYDAVIVGGAVYANHWHKATTDFVDDNADVLRRMPVWLFSSGPVGDRATQSLPIEAVDIAGMAARIHARGHTVFLGALDRSKIDGSDLGPFDRLVARSFIPQGDWRDWAAIEAWAHAVAQELAGGPVPELVGASV